MFRQKVKFSSLFTDELFTACAKVNTFTFPQNLHSDGNILHFTMVKRALRKWLSASLVVWLLMWATVVTSYDGSWW